MYYAIGDIHGRLDLLEKLYNMILEDIAKEDDPFGNTIIFLGDYIDRGPRSIGVLQFLMRLEDTDKIRHIFIEGNHEQMFVDCFDNPKNVINQRVWFDNGGEKVLKELGIPDFKTFLTGSHVIHELNWLRNSLHRFYETVDYLFVHAGIDRNERVSTLSPMVENMIRWGRWAGKDYYENYPRLVVHGHDAQRGEVQADANRINVDTGSPFFNMLTCVVLPHVRSLAEPRYLQAKGVYTEINDLRK